MKLSELLKYFKGVYIFNESVEIKNGYVGDLLSEIMRNMSSTSILITHQTHPNIVAVASIVEANTIIIPEGFEYEEKTIEKAKENDVNLLKSKYDIFETTGIIYKKLKEE
ncbi:DRTGG domain-containing protein [Marinitoga hydrogenitolerans DSM 16785]|uniref:DRTGG domain-containing protein n=1 Tax=Marinitoga hydrogenitolerans (strain DSM 16785 / JCM 12826 / AT1271) TaxID=1122195 RepID=A0A1M4Z871_MARH1|nr:DRTGG domain-containing protein [Marinitoga hydrogenitolerans]SHF13796.1 DRTGG domain-containing protein [Marinitoga hydrogenitolerans DSM 16785]